jgi:signal transduction histidine kinase
MAEVATGVLHNVGNVLNSVNVSTTLVGDKVKASKVTSLAKAATLLREHQGDLGAFLTQDPKGKQLPGFLITLATHLEAERAELLGELDALRQNVDHIKDIVAMQQNYARVSGVLETLPVQQLVEDALRINSAALDRHRIQLVRDFADVPPVQMDKHKVLQILINLIRNAKYAMDESRVRDKRLTIGIGMNGNGRVKVSVADNGVGIPPENLTRIFGHGFTTKRDGHGFGLHSGANAAKEMGGALYAQSAGVGQGATFVLELPLRRDESQS